MTIGSGGTTTRTGTSTPLAPAQSQTELNQFNQQAQTANQLLGNVNQQTVQNQQLYGGGIQSAAGNLNSQLAAGGLGTASPQQLALIQQQFAGPQQQALTALQRAASDAAASRGMSISDSPIGNPYLQQVQNLEQNIAGQQAGQALQYGQQGFQNNQQMAAFGQNLNQAANQGLMNAGQASGNLANALSNQRLSQSVNMNRGAQTSPMQFGANAGQVGQGLYGLAQAANTPAGQSALGGIGSGVSSLGSSLSGAGSSLYNNIFGQGGGAGTVAGGTGGTGSSNTGGLNAGGGAGSQPYGGMSANQASWFQ